MNNTGYPFGFFWFCFSVSLLCWLLVLVFVFWCNFIRYTCCFHATLFQVKVYLSFGKKQEKWTFAQHQLEKQYTWLMTHGSYYHTIQMVKRLVNCHLNNTTHTYKHCKDQKTGKTFTLRLLDKKHDDLFEMIADEWDEGWCFIHPNRITNKNIQPYSFCFENVANWVK